MLTQKEKNELNYNKLSPELKKKLDAAFSNPYFNATLALYIQKTALEAEMIESPFTIRGDVEMKVGEDGITTSENISQAIKEAITARQNTETAIKVSKWLIEASSDLEKLQNILTPEENREIIKKVTTAKDLNKEAFGGE